MNNFAINNLANMEYMLYGSKMGMNTGCPNYYNGYMGTVNNNMMNYYNPMFSGYNNYNSKDIFTQSQNANNAATQGNNSSNGYNPQFQGITEEDMNNLADYYAKNNALEEGFMGAAAGGLSWMAFEHAQSIFHPKNAWKGIKKAQEVFKNLPENIAKENGALLERAQIAVQQAWRDTGSKGWWSKWLRKPLNAKDIEPLIKEMEGYVKTGDLNGIATVTEKLQTARSMNGRIPGLYSKSKTVAQRLSENNKSIGTKAAELVELNKSVVEGNWKNLIKGSFKRDFVGFMIFESIFNAGKIMTAFEKDTKTGVEQAIQSAGKSALGTAGWCLGRAAGTWLGAKAGMALGMAGGPLGAGIGALIGFTVASIGMWAGHKLGNSILGKDVADKVEAENLAKTQEGQVQLLQFAMQKAQEGKTDSKTNQIVYKALNAYA